MSNLVETNSRHRLSNSLMYSLLGCGERTVSPDTPDDRHSTRPSEERGDAPTESTECGHALHSTERRRSAHGQDTLNPSPPIPDSSYDLRPPHPFRSRRRHHVMPLLAGRSSGRELKRFGQASGSSGRPSPRSKTKPSPVQAVPATRRRSCCSVRHVGAAEPA
jgi:hypothetical protein